MFMPIVVLDLRSSLQALEAARLIDTYSESELATMHELEKHVVDSIMLFASDKMAQSSGSISPEQMSAVIIGLAGMFIQKMGADSITIKWAIEMFIRSMGCENFKILTSFDPKEGNVH